MGLNSTPSADRVHIGIFGRRNAGKSSIINAITGQNLAIVSDVLGTTTDPVPKAMELLPLGPVVIIDTPGLDDTGELGQLRVKKAYQILNKTDIAVLVIDASLGMTPEDLSILKKIQDKKIPYVVVKNKSDLCSSAENGTVCPNPDTLPDTSFHLNAYTVMVKLLQNPLSTHKLLPKMSQQNIFHSPFGKRSADQHP